MSARKNLLPVAFALAVASAGVGAQTEREHEAHVHGTSRMEVAVEEGSFHLNLKIPGMDLVGFERAVRSDEDRQAVAAAIATLQASERWLSFEPAGSCTAPMVTVATPGYGLPEGAGAAHDAAAGHKHGERTASVSGQADDAASAAGDDREHHHDDHDHAGHGHAADHKGEHEHDHHDHDHGDHDHDHDHGHTEGSAHAEFVVQLQAACTAGPDAMHVRLAESFPGVSGVRVDLITDSGQNRIELSGNRTRVPLR